MTKSRMILSSTRSQALTSLTHRSLYIHMSPRMCSEMIPFTLSRFNERHRFMTDVGIFVLTFPAGLLLPFNATAVRWNWIYIRNVSILIELHVEDGSQDGEGRKVPSCVGYRVCFGRREDSLCKLCDVEVKMLVVWLLWEEKRKEVYMGRKDIYNRVPAISLFNLWVLLVNKHKMAQPSSCRATCNLMNNKPRDEI